jgi:thioredoxin-related protein
LRSCGSSTHFVNFAQPRIANYIKTNFEVLQLNIIGSRKVTDFDGTEMSEKELAAKYGVRFTPTIQFFGERAAELKPLVPAKREVARAPGYLRPDDFLAMFRFVKEKAYETKSFRDFVKAMPS